MMGRRLTTDRRPLIKIAAVCGLLFVVLAGWLITASSILAQTPVQVEISAETPQIAVGDPLPLKLTVTHPEGFRVIKPALQQEWGSVEVRDLPTMQIEENGDGTQTTTQIIVITAWEPGDYTTLPLEFELADNLGKLELVSAESVPFTVASILNPEDPNMRDIKPQAYLPVPQSPIRWLMAGGVGLLGVAAVALLWARSRQDQQAASAIPVIDNRPPHVVALDRLDEIAAQDLPAKAAFKQHYTEVTDTLRRYLEQAYKIPAMDNTTNEIRRALQSQTKLAPNNQKHLVNVLREADMVKFADVIPPREEAYDIQERARQFVQMTAAVAPTVVDEDDVLPVIAEEPDA